MANETKWTPGPWKAERCGNDIEIGAETRRGHLSVAWVHLGEKPAAADVATGTADALLLAAAPDLVETLRVVLAHVTHEETTTASEATKDAMRGIAKRVRAALAKAEGRS